MSKYYASLLISTIILLQSSQTIASPKQCWYGGITLGVSKAKTVDFFFRNPITKIDQVGNMQYAGYGDIGGQLGYRIDQFRVEGQLLYNYSPYTKLTTPTNVFLGRKDTPPFQLKGYTGIAAFMLNGYFDFMSMNAPSGLYPYLGAGVGYADVMNKFSFRHDPKNVITKHPKNYGSPAVQGIIGLGNYLDDFTSINLEYHYLTTKAKSNFRNRPQVNMLNLTLNGAFDI